MAYNKFKIVSLKSKLGIIVQKQYWLPEQLPAFEEDNLLMNVLKESARIYLGSEKARSEFVVTPILQALSRSNKDKFSIFSGYEFNIDKSIELNGFCDFILSSPTSDFVVEAPTFLLLKPKKQILTTTLLLSVVLNSMLPKFSIHKTTDLNQLCMVV